MPRKSTVDPNKPRGKPFEKGVDARRESRGVTLANARARFELDALPDPKKPLPPGFAHACDSLTLTHVLPGLVACLEQKIGSPSWRWAAEMTLKYSQRPAAADKPGKGANRPALPADVTKAVRQALHDPGVRKWIAETPGALEELRQLPEFAGEEPETEESGELASVPPSLASQDGPGRANASGEVSQHGGSLAAPRVYAEGEVASVPPPPEGVPPPQALGWQPEEG